jgi:hypothetical protein
MSTTMPAQPSRRDRARAPLAVEIARFTIASDPAIGRRGLYARTGERPDHRAVRSPVPAGGLPIVSR